MKDSKGPIDPDDRRELQAAAREIIELEPRRALERILESSHPAVLVQSMSEQDFYFLVNDIGPEDCLPVLQLASSRQWEYLLDMELWHRDQLQENQMTRWFGHLVQADEERFVHWSLDAKIDLVEFYLQRNIEIRVRQHDEDPSDFGDDFYTFDDVFYYRVKPHGPEEEEPGVLAGEERRRLIARFMHRLADVDHLRYQQLLLETPFLLPAETEESEFRWRNVRLQPLTGPAPDDTRS